MTKSQVLLLRGEEHETALTNPPAVGEAAAGAEPATLVAAVETEDVRAAAQISDRLVHHDEPPEAHRFDVRVGELFPEKRCDLRRGREVTALLRLGADLGRNAFIVRELLALDDDQLVGLAVRRDELVAPHHLLRVVADVVVRVLERLDELLAGATVRRHVADDHVGDRFHALTEDRVHLRPHGVVAENLLNGIRRKLGAEALEDRTEQLASLVDLAIGHRAFHGRGHGLRHGVILL